MRSSVRTLPAILGSTIRLQMVENSDAGEGLVEICVVVSDLGRSRYDGYTEMNGQRYEISVEGIRRTCAILGRGH
jgi:hypothetical protein